MKQILYIIFMLVGISSYSQLISSKQITKNIKVVNDTIQIDSISISPYNFQVLDNLYKKIDSVNYSVDFAKAQLVIDKNKFKFITVKYQSFPEFLTKTYSKFSEDLIVPQVTDLSRLYSVKSPSQNTIFKPFDGLNTTGSISRGVTVGNNQDAVVNSNLDIQISGNLSDKVELRASITDSNVPLQENGFTQRLDEFDRVFIELISKNWGIAAGDVNLTNNSDQFLRFNKKVAGVKVDVNFKNADDSKIHFFSSGALVRGQFSRNSFIGQEGNQGPYRIANNTTEQFVLLISGSETVYVNGMPLKRGESNDYTIDYNIGEITFNPTYPITSNMRIIVEYQYADRNFTRFVTYNGVEHCTDKFKVGLKFYNENDAKNQPVQQDLTNEQKDILSEAGDDVSKMVVPSAYAQVYDENKIQYKKEQVNGTEVYSYSTDASDNLYNVKFTYVGENQGNYNIQTTIASGRIFEYVIPINNMPQGAYEPVIQLIAPNKLQVAIFNASYNPSEKTAINSELAYSCNDLNLFSSLNDSDNKGVAGKFNWNQILIDKSWKLSSSVNYEFINKNFKTIERYRNIEFNRDWDLISPMGNQQYFTALVGLENNQKGKIIYAFDKLDFIENFNGSKHNFLADLKLGTIKINAVGSYLNSNSDQYKSNFMRWYLSVKKNFKKSWIGVDFNTENNKRTEKATEQLSNLSHKFLEYEAYVGIGDTTNVYAEIGYNYRTTDSAQVASLQKVNSAKTYFLRSKLIQNKTTDLSLFINYRTVNNVAYADEESLNSRITYRQNLLKNAIALQTIYETNSGTLPQQEYSYVEVDTGLGFYTWNDYNGNDIKELDEFEIAQFQDEANYVRVLLPTINFIKTNQNKFSQSLTINASQWSNKEGFKKFLSHFINQSSILIDGKKARANKRYDFNPFSLSSGVLTLNMNVKNSLFFNRGKQHYSTTYTYLKSKNSNSFSVSNQDNNLSSHQVLFNHKLRKFWLIDFKASFNENKSSSAVFTNRNYIIKSYELHPKISYVYNSNSRFEAYYQYKDKENVIGDLEALKMHTIGANIIYALERKFSLNSSLNIILNNYNGSLNSAVAYQMLEGLRPGTNYTWSLNFQKKITTYLDFIINYNGRKSEQTKAIHTGSIQLRATF